MIPEHQHIVVVLWARRRWDTLNDDAKRFLRWYYLKGFQPRRKRG